ncbi:fatty acid desaturase [Pseudooceanicola algae]|uniref:Fatty acid desaturase domain-containing protein n=1 Tax=Pseudooceanicola algae TaxID=1537215 RepID=A0A418SCJ2_9RHOB|nr:fatty acid desaturase [Pseudooceanicola algae]QPM90098.1 hypothetical protein PSAL_013320 [Pseudooceanicola algae]
MAERARQLAPPRPASGGARHGIEWPTLALIGFCYALWAVSTTWLAAQALPLAICGVAVTGALHSSLSHEALHGHPFALRWLNAALVFPALSLVVPYLRFEATHLAHHRDEVITDPYDDPESNFTDPRVWNGLAPWQQAVLRFNNRLAGRILIGPTLGMLGFAGREICRARAGDPAVLRGWLGHLPALGVVIVWQASLSQMPLWAFLTGSYAGLSILKIRTFLEHQAHDRASGRTVIIEDRGPLAWLFLNNNLHVVHHMHPRRPWYQLPALYRARKAHYLRRNGGYFYRSYAEVFRRYFRRAKDPVPHPIWCPPTD